MDVEPRIAAWRAHLARQRVDVHEAEELEAHLRDEMAELERAGLAGDEAFLVAVTRLGSVHAVAREFARENSARLWKQLVLPDDTPARGLLGGTILLALLAAAAVHAPRLLDAGPEDVARNAAFLVLPFLAAYRAWRSEAARGTMAAAGGVFVVAGVAVNAYPWAEGSATEILTALHLPVALWFVALLPFTGSSSRSPEARMDVVRFTGEWLVYYALIALGGGVLLGLASLILEPVTPGATRILGEWVLPSGAAGAVVVAAALVEAKRSVVENMAPVLTAIFTPLFGIMLVTSAVTYAARGGAPFDRSLLTVFDGLLVVVLGLVLYTMSARTPGRGPSLTDGVELVTVVAALGLDVMVLASMAARIGELGPTPNRTAALGLNALLLVDLAGIAAHSARFLGGRVPYARLERWQMAYLPVFGVWAAAVAVLFPVLFGFA